MKIFALELNNDIKGIKQRKKYIESLLAKIESPDLVVLPELAICSYLANKGIWDYRDLDSDDTSKWAMYLAGKYHTYIGVGYLEYDGQDYYNSYLLADGKQIYGIVRKCEGEAYVFKRGDFNHVVATPFGQVAIAICYDARRKHFYNSIVNQELSLILFPHGSPGALLDIKNERAVNDHFCQLYLQAFDVPVVYVNSRGKLDFMLGMTGKMMARAGFSLNGQSKIYFNQGCILTSECQEALGIETVLKAHKRKEEIRFHGKDINHGNFLFRKLILPWDIRKGVRFYEQNK